ncbi:hypothetical protein ABPG74_012588 [Tetrahymena malaccensis]
MGNEPPKPAPVKPVDPMDAILDMKMTAKQFERESKKAEQESKKLIEKAKQALQKGNEEGAKLYLQNSSMKQKHSINMMRMANKLDAVQCQMKMAQGNTQMVAQLNKITPYLQFHSQNLPLEQMYGQMANFEQAMDEITVQQKVMDGVMNKNDMGTDIAVDNMLNQLKMEYAMEINQNLQQSNNAVFNDIKNKNQNLINQNPNNLQEFKQI